METKFKNKLKKLIENSKTAFITSIDESNYPNIKAMLAPRKIHELKTFHFTTNTSSNRVSQYRKNDKASIYFYNEATFEGLMLRGTMQVSEKTSDKELIWQDKDTMYYKKGIADPDYCVLIFTAFDGRYYNNLNSTNFNID